MSHIPNAWDDDPDSLSAAPRNPPPAPKPSHAPAPRISRAERRAQHEEANKALWNSAEAPERFHFLEVNNAVPLQSQPRPQLKVLSRRPKVPVPPSSIVAGMQSLNVQSGADEDSEEEERRKQAAAIKERQEAARLEREEKQRRYNERRQQLFGASSDQASGGNGGLPSQASPASRGRGRRGRGGAGRGSHTPSSVEQSPTRASNAGPRQLYDPSAASRPEGAAFGRRAEPEGGQPSRQPRGAGAGPGFASRGRGRVGVS